MKIAEARLRELADQIHEQVSGEEMTPLKRFEISNRFSEPDWRDLVRRVISAGSGNVRAFGEDFQRKPEIDPVEFKSILKTHRRPMLYCFTARFISQGSPSEISDKARVVITKIGPGGGVTLYGAMVPKETPPENVRSLVKAAKQFSSYPISI
jgi:hypothetical protein